MKRRAQSNADLPPICFVSNTGKSKADGLTAARAITEGERQRRWGEGPVLLRQPATVIYLDSPAEFVNYDAVIADGAGLRILGTRSAPTASGTFTGIVAQDRPTQTPWSVQDLALTAGWSDQLGRLIRIPTGPRAGAYARLLKDEGTINHQARISPFGTFTGNEFGQLFAMVTPSVGDPYEVFTAPVLKLGKVRFSMNTQSNATMIGGFVQNAVTFEDVFLDGNFQSAGISSLFVPVFLRESIANLLWLESDFFLCAGGGVDNLYLGAPSFAELHGVGTASSAQVMIVAGPGSFAMVDGDSIGQNVAINALRGGGIEFGFAAFFDRSVADNALLTGNHGGGRFESATGVYGGNLVWGTNNAGHGIRISGLGAMEYVTKPTINGGLGAGREALVGGEDTLYAAIAPNKIAANGARFVVHA